MKIIEMSFDQFCRLIPNCHEPNYKVSRYAECAFAITKNGTSYIANQHFFYKHYPQIFQYFTDRMFKIKNDSNSIDGNMLTEHTIEKYKKSDKLYIINLFSGAKMILSDLNLFARYINHSGQTVVCYSLLGVTLLK